MLLSKQYTLNHQSSSLAPSITCKLEQRAVDRVLEICGFEKKNESNVLNDWLVFVAVCCHLVRLQPASCPGYISDGDGAR